MSPQPTYAQFHGESDEEEEEESDDSEDEGSEAEGEEYDEEEEEEDDDDDDDNENMEVTGLDRDRQRTEVIEKKLAAIPFETLMKARRAMASASGGEQEVSDLEEDEWARDRALAAQRFTKQAVGSSASDEMQEDKRRQVKERLNAMRSGSRLPSTEQSGEGTEQNRNRERRELQKRSSKHAPTEISSRRPVTRKRSVIETQSKDLRDPRFSTLTGNEVDAELFRKSYSFLPEMHQNEISSLRQTLSKLRKAETHQAGPKATSEGALKIREERERVARALKRSEAKEAERQRREREREVMKSFKRENEERVSRGGKRFYLKDAAKRELMLQDKFLRLADGKKSRRQEEQGSSSSSSVAPTMPTVEAGATSSSKALRKALDKRRRKNAVKERKTMPFLEAGRRSVVTDGRGGGASGPPLRRSSGSGR